MVVGRTVVTTIELVLYMAEAVELLVESPVGIVYMAVAEELADHLLYQL
jgi:hypothetical protein